MRTLPLNGGLLKATELHLGWMNTHKSEAQKLVASSQTRTPDAARSVDVASSQNEVSSPSSISEFSSEQTTATETEPIISTEAITTMSTSFEMPIVHFPSTPSSSLHPDHETHLTLSRSKRQVDGVTDPTGNTPRFKGVLQDVRVGTLHVPLTLQPVSGRRFGKILEKHNILEGRVVRNFLRIV